MDTPENREAPIRVNFGAGLHAAAGHHVDDSAYYQYIGRWSRLFVPAVLAAAEVASGDRVLDIATGPGEAALAAQDVLGDLADQREHALGNGPGEQDVRPARPLECSRRPIFRRAAHCHLPPHQAIVSRRIASASIS